MKYIAFAYNMFTLAHVIGYTNETWGCDNVEIIYSDIATSVPEAIIKDYGIHYIPANGVLSRRRIDAIICSCKLSREIWKTVNRLISNTMDQITLVVFRDNEVEEATFIENAFKKYNDRIHLYIMEEGAGLYAKEKPAIRYLFVKRLFYAMYGVSCYSLQNRTQGMHPCIEKIICSKPELIREKVGKKPAIEIVRDVFKKELNEYLIRSVCGDNKSQKKYKYVFLTQPFDMFRDEYDKLFANHKKLLPEVFNILSSRGNVIIKLHPREHFDYSQYVNKHIDISSEQEKILPFQCLLQYYHNPQMISMFSSASVGIQKDKPSIYLFGIFQIPGVEKYFDEAFYRDNKIIPCRNLEEFKEVIYQ